MVPNRDGSSELITNGCPSDIRMAAGWFRRSDTSFRTYDQQSTPSKFTFVSDTIPIHVKRFRSVIHMKTERTCLLSLNMWDMWRPLAARLQIPIKCTEPTNLTSLLCFPELLKFLGIFIDLVGDGAQLHGHISFL